MNKYNIIASHVENDTTASFPMLMEDESIKILSKYANENLI